MRPAGCWSPASASDTRDLTSATEQRGHTLFEHLEERIVGRPGKMPVIARLEKDRELPDGERHEPALVTGRTPGCLLPTLNELRTSGEAGRVGDRLVPGKLLAVLQ